MDQDRNGAQVGRLLQVLEGLLGVDAISLDDAMARAAQQIAEALAADKVDVFLHDEAGKALIAVGTSDTPMGRRQHDLGLDRLRLADGGRAVDVFRSGTSFMSGRSDQDPNELPGIVRDLGVRSSLIVPLDIAGERRGVLSAVSATPDDFSELDLRFMSTVAGWVGLVGYRVAHVERLAAQAAREGMEAAAEELGQLTGRQREVAGLIASGLTNVEIARRLVLTPGTVANHVEHILRRLGLRSRVQIATWAVGRGLAGDAGSGPGISSEA